MVYGQQKNIGKGINKSIGIIIMDKSGEIAKNDTPQMAKERILSNFKIQLEKEEEKLKHHLDQSLNDDEIGDTKDYVEGLTKIAGKNSKENEE